MFELSKSISSGFWSIEYSKNFIVVLFGMKCRVHHGSFGVDRFRCCRQELDGFTRSEMKVERVSYEVMTPSAARDVLQAILWKPQIAWHIQSIAVLAPIRWASFRRNEVQKIAPKMPKPGEEIIVEDEWTQRKTVALRDVDYVVEAWSCWGASRWNTVVAQSDSVHERLYEDDVPNLLADLELAFSVKPSIFEAMLVFS
jgi:CRISPR-associated protein Cas5 subtype I-C